MPVCSLPSPESRQSRCPTPIQRQSDYKRVIRHWKCAINAWTSCQIACGFVAHTKRISCLSKLWRLRNPIGIAMSVATSSDGPTTPSTKRTHLLDKVCLVIDLEGFCLGDQFLPRELGWCDWTGQHRGSIHYKPSVPWPDLSPKD